MYGCESWTIKKAEPWRIDAFELWCWRRLLRVPWTARRSSQFILKEISPECSLEGLMLSWNSNTLATWCEELTELKRPWCWERLKVGGEGDDRGWDGWMASLTRWTWVWESSGSWWWAGRPGELRSVGHRGSDRALSSSWPPHPASAPSMPRLPSILPCITLLVGPAPIDPMVSVLGFTGSYLAHLNLSLSSLRASPPPLIYSHAATDYLLSLWVLLCLLWTRLLKSLLWLPVPDCTAHISGLKDLRVWPQPFSTLFSTWFHQHHLDSLPVPGHAYLSSSLPTVPCLATWGHKGDLAEPCLLRPNTAFLCILFLSYLEVVLHCIFVEVSGAALGTGMSILGSADATPSVFHWALPSPVLWSEAWPSSGKSWSPRVSSHSGVLRIDFMVSWPLSAWLYGSWIWLFSCHFTAQVDTVTVSAEDSLSNNILNFSQNKPNTSLLMSEW